MKDLKKRLLTALAVIACGTGVSADNVFLHSPDNFQVLSVSPNGKWACGVFIDLSGNTFGFRWNLDSGSIEMLGADVCTAFDIANDGTVSGDFNDTEVLDSGAPVVMPGFWRDGKWHHLEVPANVIDGIGYGISPDGQYMTGAILVNELYTPYIWKNGKIHRAIDVANHGVAFAVSPDGNSAAGFLTQYNRTACLWPAEGDPVLFMDSPEYSQGPWSYARNFSPDGTKLLYWGGWDSPDNENLILYSVYNIATGERVAVTAPSLESDLEFFDISNNGTLVGQDTGRGYIWTDGKGMYIDEYLAARGVDMTKFDDFYAGTDYYQDMLPIYNVVSLSEDENVLAMLYYDKEGNMSSMILKMDQDLDKAVPAEVSAKQLAGLSTVGLTWKRPVGAANIRGYNIYRDGKKINGFLPINLLSYYDKNVDHGNHVYEVSAVMTTGSENKAGALSLDVQVPGVESPIDIYARQKGINSAHVSWKEPFSNIAHKRYYNPASSDLTNFSIYAPIVVEAAVKFDKNEMANYTGHKLTDVTFFPAGDQEYWAINIYTYNAQGKLELLATQPVTQKLKFKELNTVKLDNPLVIDGKEIVVAIEVGVKEDVTLLIGADRETVVPGYSDLLRQKTDADFFSTFESSVESSVSITSMSWIIDLGLTPDGYSEDDNAVDHYNVYINGENAGSTKETYLVVPSLADGTYSVGVDAVYATGKTSALNSCGVTVKGAYKGVDNVEVSQGDNTAVVTAKWSAPADADTKTVSYVKSDRHTDGMKGVESNGYAMMAAVEFPPKMLRGYDGYTIKSLRFYPMADAVFTLMLLKDDECISEIEVEDYTLGRWNDVEIPEDLTLETKSQYKIILDCFDPVPDAKLVGIDQLPGIPYFSDLFSIDNGETWSSFNSETGLNGNWMLGMVLGEKEAPAAEVSGYDIVIDGKKCNDTVVTSTEYEYNFVKGDDKQHTLRVDTYYPAKTEAVQGGVTKFILSASGIADGMIADITLAAGDNLLTVTGEGVEAVTVVSTAGNEVAASTGNTVNISHLLPGVYVVVIDTTAGTAVRKVNIR